MISILRLLYDYISIRILVRRLVVSSRTMSPPSLGELKASQSIICMHRRAFVALLLLLLLLLLYPVLLYTFSRLCFTAEYFLGM